MNTTTSLKITAARTALVLDQPFWGVLALRLKPVATDDVKMGATDGVSLFYNPEYVDGLPFDELVGLIAEEVGHCAMGHAWRRDGRDAKRWNVACDYALAGLLKDAGFNTGDMLHDAQWHGQSAEWIYDRLPQPQPPQQGGGGQGQPQSDQGDAQGDDDAPESGGRAEVLDAPGDAGDDASEQSWKQAVQQAAVAAKRGTDAGGVGRLVKDAARARVDWRGVLRRFVQQLTTADYTWTRPSPRYVARGLYLPAMRSESLGAIAVAIDTSGSVDSVLLDQFQTEVRALVDETSPERVHVIYCDARVHGIDTFERGELVTFNAKGGGGTAFAPAIDAAEALDDDLACLVYLTDLEGSHRDEPPQFPVLWVSTRNGQPPYGDVVVVQ